MKIEHRACVGYEAKYTEDDGYGYYVAARDGEDYTVVGLSRRVGNSAVPDDAVVVVEDGKVWAVWYTEV